MLTGSLVRCLCWGGTQSAQPARVPGTALRTARSSAGTAIEQIARAARTAIRSPQQLHRPLKRIRYGTSAPQRPRQRGEGLEHGAGLAVA